MEKYVTVDLIFGIPSRITFQYMLSFLRRVSRNEVVDEQACKI